MLGFSLVSIPPATHPTPPPPGIVLSLTRTIWEGSRRVQTYLGRIKEDPDRVQEGLRMILEDTGKVLEGSGNNPGTNLERSDRMQACIQEGPLNDL